MSQRGSTRLSGSNRVLSRVPEDPLIDLTTHWKDTMRQKITTAVVANTRPPATGRLEIFDEYLPGFALRITSNGVRSFVVRARVKGHNQPVTLTLGDVRDMKLAEARQAASDALRKMRAGTDPREEKKAAAEVVELE